MAGEAEGVARDSGAVVTDAGAAEDSDQVVERVAAGASGIATVPREVGSVEAPVGAVASDRADPQIVMVAVQTDIRQAVAVGHAAISEARVEVGRDRDIAQARADRMTVQEAPKLAADSKLKDFSVFI